MFLLVKVSDSRPVGNAAGCDSNQGIHCQLRTYTICLLLSERPMRSSGGGAILTPSRLSSPLRPPAIDASSVCQSPGFIFLGNL